MGCDHDLTRTIEFPLQRGRGQDGRPTFHEGDVIELHCPLGCEPVIWTVKTSDYQDHEPIEDVMARAIAHGAILSGDRYNERPSD